MFYLLKLLFICCPIMGIFSICLNCLQKKKECLIFLTISFCGPIITNHLLVLCAVRFSNKLRSWNENQMAHLVVARLQWDSSVHLLLLSAALQPSRCSEAQTQATCFLAPRGLVRKVCAHVLLQNNTWTTTRKSTAESLLLCIFQGVCVHHCVQSKLNKLSFLIWSYQKSFLLYWSLSPFFYSIIPQRSLLF